MERNSSIGKEKVIWYVGDYYRYAKDKSDENSRKFLSALMLPSDLEKPRRVMYGEQYRNVRNGEALSRPITEMGYKD